MTDMGRRMNGRVCCAGSGAILEAREDWGLQGIEQERYDNEDEAEDEAEEEEEERAVRRDR